MCWGRCERVTLLSYGLGIGKRKIDHNNKKVEEDNGIGGTHDNGRFRKVRRSSRNELWNNIRCIL